MPSFAPRFVVTAISALTLSALTSFSHAQTQDESETSTQIVQFAGAMHATAVICEAYPEQKLLEYKREQQARMAEQGMDEETFDQSFAQGRQQAEARWKELSSEEKQQACKELEDQTSDMTAPAE